MFCQAFDKLLHEVSCSSRELIKYEQHFKDRAFNERMPLASERFRVVHVARSDSRSSS
jgi:hypothetical protein